METGVLLSTPSIIEYGILISPPPYKRQMGLKLQKLKIRETFQTKLQDLFLNLNVSEKGLLFTEIFGYNGQAYFEQNNHLQ